MQTGLSQFRDNESPGEPEYLIGHISLIGPVVKAELGQPDSSSLIDVEISREEFEKLSLRVNEKISVKLKNLKLFENSTNLSG